MTPTILRKLCLAASLALAAVPAVAETAAIHDQRIERLTDSMVVLMPFGTIFGTLAAADPAWPVMDKIDEVSARELVCLRGELSAQGFRRYIKGLVKAYADANPARLDADIALVESGVAEMFGKLVLAGAEGERTGVQVMPEEVLAGYSATQMESFMAFFTDEKYAGLRQVAGMDNAFDQNRTAKENEAAGEQQGADLAGKLMARAIDTCGVEIP